MTAAFRVRASCPHAADSNVLRLAATAPNDSKTLRGAVEVVQPEPGSQLLQRFADLRRVLRSAASLQSGVEVAGVEQEVPTRASIFFLDGKEHARRRAAIGGFFTPDAITRLHMPAIEAAADSLIAELRANGVARLDDLSLRLSAAVASKIIGLANSDTDRMARRIAGASRATMTARGGVWKLIAQALATAYGSLVFYLDVRPAIAERRAARRQDVISRLLDEGRSDREILVECMTFGLAGIGTTREFMVVAAWHLFERDNLRRRFLDGDDAEKMAILLEILRIEPVASMIYRTVGEDHGRLAAGPMARGARASLCIRAANLDEAAVGPDPAKIDPERAKRLNVNAAYMSFGDGAHRCPGFQLALTETRVFLDKLLRVPGIRLDRAPDIGWAPALLMSYELRNCVIGCIRS